MHKVLLAAALAVVATWAAPCLAADLDTILADNYVAHGGDAYRNIQSLRVRLHIKEPTFEVEGLYVATREGKMRIDIYAGDQRVYAEGLMDGPDGVCAWEWRPDFSAEQAAQCVGETETAALRHGIEMPGHFFTLQDVRAQGAAAELIGEVEGDAGPEWQVRLTLADGFARDYFISQESHRITRARDHRAFHPGIDATEVTVETRVSEPYFLDGVLRSKQQENVNVDSGEVLGVTTVIEAEHNPEIPEGYFEPAYVP